MDILQNDKPGQWVQGWIRQALSGESWLMFYIFTMPFVSAFAFSGTISLPLIFAVILCLLMSIKIIFPGKIPVGFIGFDLVLIVLFLFLVLFSFAINGWGNAKSFNHTVAYLSTFLLFYIAIKFTFFSITGKEQLVKKIIHCITWVTIISAVYANLEFITSNLFNINLNDFIPRPSEEEKFYDASVVGLFFRARGFAPESGHFTFMMELFSPLAIYYIYFSSHCPWNTLVKGFTVVLILCSIIFAASSAAFIIIPLTVLLATLVHLKRVVIYIKKHLSKFIITATLASIVIFLLNYFFSFYALLILSLTDKLDSTSFDDRQERVDFFYDKFFHFDPVLQLSGAGPAGYTNLGFDESKSILSLYYNLTFELGYLGLFLMLLFFLYILFQTLKIKSKIGFFLLISVSSGIIHYYFIANFWYPWFWFIAAFAIFCSKKISNG